MYKCLRIKRVVLQNVHQDDSMILITGPFMKSLVIFMKSIVISVVFGIFP